MVLLCIADFLDWFESFQNLDTEGSNPCSWTNAYSNAQLADGLTVDSHFAYCCLVVLSGAIST